MFDPPCSSLETAYIEDEKREGRELPVGRGADGDNDRAPGSTKKSRSLERDFL